MDGEVVFFFGIESYSPQIPRCAVVVIINNRPWTWIALPDLTSHQCTRAAFVRVGVAA
jgi:hypothetical protein